MIDLNYFWSSGNAPVLQQSTTIMLLMRLDVPGIRNAHRLLSAIDRAGGDPVKVRLVAARHGRPKEAQRFAGRGRARHEKSALIFLRTPTPSTPASIAASR